MQRKKIKQLIALVVVFTVLVGFYAWFSSYKDKEKKKEEDSKKEEVVTILEIDKSKLRSIEYDYENEKHTLVYDTDDEKWSVKGKEKWPINQEKIAEMVDAITNITSAADIKSKEKSEFGLDKPKMTIALKLKQDGETKTHTLKFGNIAPNSLGYYCTLDEQEKIYVADISVYTSFECKDKELLEVEVIKGVASEAVYSLDIKSKDRNIKARYDGDIINGKGKWLITKPYKNLKGVTSAFTEYFVNFETLSFGESVIDFGHKKDKTYGLDKPQYEIEIKYFEEIDIPDDKSTEENEFDTEITDEKKTLTLLIGGEITQEFEGQKETAGYFVRKKGDDRVYQVEAHMIEGLIGTTAFDFLDKAVMIDDLSTYKNLKVEIGDDTYSMSKKATKVKSDDGSESTEYKYRIDGKDANLEKANEVTGIITALMYNGEIEKDIKKDKVIATLKYVSKSGDKDVKFEFLNYSEYQYRVRMNGKETFLVPSKDIDVFVERIEILSKESKKAK